MANFVPVEHDPFAPAPAQAPAPMAQPGASPAGQRVTFAPVDYDPFADAPPAQSQGGETPAGFATRAQREGGDMQMRQAEYLADAVRVRAQQDKASPMGRLDAYARGVAGWIPGMDKLAAAGDAALGAGQGDTFGARYSDNLERQRAMDAADAAYMPGSRMAGQAAGLAATAAVLPGVTVAKEGLRGAATANSAATGGLYAGLTGAIESDGGVADKAMAGVESGSLGLLMGAAAPTVIAGAGKVAQGIGNLAAGPINTVRGLINPEAEAARRVGRAFQRDGVTDPIGALRTMQAGGAPAVAGDVGGETTRALARSSANTSTEGRQALQDATSERFAGQGDRVVDLLRGLGAANAGKTLDDLQAAARAANRPAYARAYMEGGTGIWTDDLQSLAQAPAVQDAIRNVIKTAQNKTVAERMPPVRNPFTTDEAGNLILARNADGSTATPNLQFWDYVQRELRGKAGEAGRAGNKDLAGDFNSLRRALVQQLDDAVPAFKRARSGAAEAFQAEDALEAGQKFVISRMANDEARKAVAKMSPAERDLFAEGFRSDLIAKVREINDGRDVVKALFDSPAARERVRIALGPRQTVELEAALNIERTMMLLQKAVSGNSTTVQQLAAMGLAGGAGGTAGGVSGYSQGGGWSGAAGGALAGAVAGAAIRKGNMRINEGLARKVGEMLASGKPADLERVAKMAMKTPAINKLLSAMGDEAAKIGGLSGPLEVTVRPRGMLGNVPAAAETEQQ